MQLFEFGEGDMYKFCESRHPTNKYAEVKLPGGVIITRKVDAINTASTFFDHLQNGGTLKVSRIEKV